MPIVWALQDSTSFNPEQVQVQAQSIGVPVGTVIVWTKKKIPDGWLECNGQPVNATLYPDLHELMPNTPNYQGMFLRGSGNQTLDHGRYGSTTHGTSLGEIQGDTARNWDLIAGSAWTVKPGGGTGYEILWQGTGPDGGKGGWYRVRYQLAYQVPTSTENRPVNIGVKYIIKAE